MAAVGVSGGDRFNIRLGSIANKAMNAKIVRVGFLEGSTEADGTSIPMIAAIQEFGAPNVGIPPRPYFRTMIKAHKTEWGPATGRLLKLHDYDAQRVLALMGEVIAGQLRQSIVDLQSPPLGPVTLMLRWMKWKNPNLVITGKTVGEAAARVKAGKSSAGVSTKPLVWTGTMLNSIDYEVIT